MTLKSNKKYDVGILGWWYGKNYGSILTYYGLNRAIESLGFSVLMVNEPTGYNAYRATWPDDILSMQFARRVGYNYTEQKHYSLLPELNEEVGTFVVGSDQLWNPLIGRVNDDLFLDFVSPENRRVAYGTSFGNRGTAKFKPKFIAKHAPNLQKFNAISVREKYAIATARDIFGVDADLVVDPVFLLPREHYQSLAQQATDKVSGDYLAVFFLDPTPEKKAAAEAIADKLGLQRIVVIPNPDNGRKLVSELFTEDRFEVIGSDSPENFLHTYSNASYVVTDSFHGTAFAAIFEKPFSSIYNTHRGADRFKNLLASLGFGESRRVFETEIEKTIHQNPKVSFDVDFSASAAYIRDGRDASMQWLKDALSGKTVKRKRNRAAPEVKPAPKKQVIPQGNAAAVPAPVARVGRVFGRVVKASLGKFRYALKSKSAAPVQLKFVSNSPAWEVSNEADRSVLRVVEGGGKKGNLVWCDLPHKLEPGLRYRLDIDWELRTAANVVTINLKNEATGKYIQISHIAVGEKRAVRRTDAVFFSVTGAGFNQIMFGSSQFLGTKPEMKVYGIDICLAGEQKETVEPAVPLKTRSMQNVFDEIRASELIESWYEQLTQYDPELDIRVAESLKDHTHNKVGGPADLMAFPRSTEQMSNLVNTARKNAIPVTILGLCTNVLIRDGGIRGLVISMTGLDHKRLEDGVLTVGAGAGLTETAFFLQEHGKSCLEWAAGIPGTVGGAVYMNAGTNISDIRRSVDTVTFMDDQGHVKTLSVSDISWGKRHSTFQENKGLVILEARFRTKDGDADAMRKEMEATVNKRARHFPLDLPNHGSTFKWWRAPRLVSQAGLTGYKIGDAQISTKQPGFIVNNGKATASDYEALINYTIAKVYEFSGFLMEPEVEIIGERLHRYERYAVGNSVEASNNLDDR